MNAHGNAHTSIVYINTVTFRKAPPMSLGQGSDLGVAEVLQARGHHLTTTCPCWMLGIVTMAALYEPTQ